MVVLLLALGACAERDTARIRIGVPTEPLTLDPRFASDALSARLVRLVHRAPVDFDLAANPVPDLATWIELDARHYRLTLRADARFNDGHAVTAHDVAATYRSVLDPAIASPHRGALANIAGIEVIDANTVDFELTRADALFPGTLVIGVLSAHDLERSAARDDWQSSAGRFERVERRTDGVTVLRRREDAQLFEFVPVKDLTVRAMQLLAGELDIVQGNLAPEIHAWLAARPELRGSEVPGTTFSYLGFNLVDAVTGQHDVRLAIAHALDREAIVRHVFGGTARLAAGLFAPGHWAAAPSLAAPVHDPRRARQLLAQAGYGDRRLRLVFKTSSDHFRVRLATIMQSQLAEVGIDLAIESHDWGTFYGDITHGRFQLYGLSWVGLAQPDIFRHAFHSLSLPPAGANRGGYRSAVVDGLIEAAERAPDRALRQSLYADLQAQVLEDLPYIPLWFEDHLVIMRRDIVGYATDANGTFDGLARTSRRKPHATR